MNRAVRLYVRLENPGGTPFFENFPAIVLLPQGEDVLDLVFVPEDGKLLIVPGVPKCSGSYPSEYFAGERCWTT